MCLRRILNILEKNSAYNDTVTDTANYRPTETTSRTDTDSRTAHQSLQWMPTEKKHEIATCQYTQLPRKIKRPVALYIAK